MIRAGFPADLLTRQPESGAVGPIRHEQFIRGTDRKVFDEFPTSITVAPTPHLDNKHSVFGEVTAGMDVVNAIVNAKATGSKPEKDIKIISIDIIGDFKPVEVKKSKQMTSDDLKKLTSDYATKLLKKIAEVQDYGTFQTINLVDSRSRGGQAQVYYKADFSKRKNLQIVIIGDVQNNKFSMQQFQFAEVAPQ